MRRKMGQHFLKDKTALAKIAGALSLEPGDTVIEIGAGHGELTEKLKDESEKLKTGTERVKIIAIEKDLNLAELLKKKFEGEGNIEIVEGDALEKLKAKSEKLFSEGGSASGGKTYKIVGNIPYYITGHLLRTIGELENKPEICVLTIQKEVALRITAEPPKMNRLAAAVQFWAEPKIIDYLPAKLFSPAPEVDSAIVKLKVKSEKRKIKEGDYYKMIRIIFQQPRKTILNNLVSGLDLNRLEITKILNKIGISYDLRPQNMTIENIIELANSLAEK